MGKIWVIYEDMSKSYKEWLTLDRIDVKWSYCKENCRWATMKEQQRNRGNNVRYKWKCLSEYREQIWMSKWVFDRLRYIKKLTLAEIFK